MASTEAGLARRLGITDAVMIGLGSMMGAGVFSAFAPAARAAGAGLLGGLVIAALVAWCNATSSAQLAASYPVSGGTYVYGRERLGAWWGFTAGWGFVVGKTASCAAMALTFAAYSVSGSWRRPVAAMAVVGIAAVNMHGITRTARVTKILVFVVLLALGVVVAASTVALSTGPVIAPGLGDGPLLVHGWYGVAQSGGLLFFAFAGYARIATMGEEVRAPERTIPRAIVVALTVTVLVYAVVGIAILSALGPAVVAGSHAPLIEAALASGWGWAGAVVQIGAAAAALGALLALMTGVGRTTLAMARTGDLPRVLAAVNPRYQVPQRAELAVALVIAALVVTVDLRAVIGFSSFTVLLYYAITNICAFTQPTDQRRYPHWAQIFGVIGCLLLAATLPPVSVVSGVAVLAFGLLYRVGRRVPDHFRRESPEVR